MAIDCVEAISTSTGMELLVLEPNQQITTHQGKLCVEVIDNETCKRIQVKECALSQKAGDFRDKWIIDHKGYIKSMKDQRKCIQMLGDEIEVQTSVGSIKAEASSSMSDNQHQPGMAIDGTEDGYWASNPGAELANFFVIFESILVREIEIQWKYPPLSFDVLGKKVKRLLIIYFVEFRTSYSKE